MMNLEQLREYLKESKADCEIIEHEKPILKTKDAAEYFELELCAPVFVIAPQQGLVAMVMSAQRMDIDVSSIKTVLGYDVKGLADPKVVKQATGYEAGRIPLVGHNLPILFDKQLTIHDFIYGGTGDEFHTLKIRPEDVIRLNNMIDFIE